MFVRTGDVGKILFVGTEFSLLGNTSVGLRFTSPCGENTFERETPDCEAPTVASGELPLVGYFSGNTYISYRIKENDFPESGVWIVQSIFKDSNTPKVFYGNPTELVVNDLG